MSAVKLAENIRAYGHLAADIYPLKDTPLDTKLIEIETYGLTEGDLRKIPAEYICPASTETAKDGYEAVEYLKQLYTTTLAFEFQHVSDVEEKQWLRNMVESREIFTNLNKREKNCTIKTFNGSGRV